jgi:hypothetical protein
MEMEKQVAEQHALVKVRVAVETAKQSFVVADSCGASVE